MNEFSYIMGKDVDELEKNFHHLLNLNIALPFHLVLMR